MGIRSSLNSRLDSLVAYYLKNYKKLVLIPIAIVIILGSSILYHKYAGVHYVNEDVSLTGGISLTVNTNATISSSFIANNISSALGGRSVSVSVLHNQFTGQVNGYIVTVGGDVNATQFTQTASSAFGFQLNSKNSSVNFISSTLAHSAIYDSLILLVVAFFLVALVSLFYFRNLPQAFSNVISIVADVINVVGVMDIVGLPFSTASIAGILMLMGYSADRNIILATNILKRKEGSMKYRLAHTIKTSITMDAAAVLTFIVLFLGTSNQIIQNIAIILIIGVIFDDFTVWILNGSIQLTGIHFKSEEETKV